MFSLTSLALIRVFSRFAEIHAELEREQSALDPALSEELEDLRFLIGSLPPSVFAVPPAEAERIIRQEWKATPQAPSMPAPGQRLN